MEKESIDTLKNIAINGRAKMATETYILRRIEMMQQELEQLKKTLLKKGELKPVSLRGIWKDIDISDEEIEEAKRSLFKEAIPPKAV